MYAFRFDANKGKFEQTLANRDIMPQREKYWWFRLGGG
jgi:hypothetical protein